MKQLLVMVASTNKYRTYIHGGIELNDSVIELNCGWFGYINNINLCA